MNNLLSYSSLKLELFSKDGALLESASGFVVEANNQFYLVTNWHVVSGKDFSAGELVEPGAKPHILETSIHIYGGEGEKSSHLI